MRKGEGRREREGEGRARKKKSGERKSKRERERDREIDLRSGYWGTRDCERGPRGRGFQLGAGRRLPSTGFAAN